MEIIKRKTLEGMFIIKEKTLNKCSEFKSARGRVIKKSLKANNWDQCTIWILELIIFFCIMRYKVEL